MTLREIRALLARVRRLQSQIGARALADALHLHPSTVRRNLAAERPSLAFIERAAEVAPPGRKKPSPRKKRPAAASSSAKQPKKAKKSAKKRKPKGIVRPRQGEPAVAEPDAVWVRLTPREAAQVEEQRRLAFQERERLAELPVSRAPIEFEELPPLPELEPGILAPRRSKAPPTEPPGEVLGHPGRLSPAEFEARALRLEARRQDALETIDDQGGARSGGKPVTHIRFDDHGALLGVDSYGRSVRGYMVRNNATGGQFLYWTGADLFKPPPTQSNDPLYEALRPPEYEVVSSWSDPVLADLQTRFGSPNDAEQFRIDLRASQVADARRERARVRRRRKSSRKNASRHGARTRSQG